MHIEHFNRPFDLLSGDKRRFLFLLTNRPFLSRLVPLFQDEFSWKTFYMWAEHIFIWMVRTKTRFETEAKGSSESSWACVSLDQHHWPKTHSLWKWVFANLETVSYEDHEEANSPEVFNWSSDDLCYVKGLASSVTPSSIIDSISVLPLIILVVATR